jgi:DNA adenine methylase
MKPLISYYGGKQRIASKIIPHIHKIPHTVYCEPYAGGLAVLFAKGKPDTKATSNYREVINDIDNKLITLYRVAREQPEEFKRLIELTPYSQSEHQRSKEILKSSDGYSDLEIAWAYYVNTLQSFAKCLFAGWGRSVYSKNDASTWNNKQHHLSEALERLSDVYIACEDALKCIKNWDSPQTLFYVDPPYPNTDQQHYKGFTLEDWTKLCETLDNVQGSYVLSGYPQNVEPESSQEKIEIETVCSAKKSTGLKTEAQTRSNIKRTEVLWICDRSENIKPELKKVLNMVS